METARVISADELKGWRRKLPRGWQRAVSKPHSGKHERAEATVGEDTAVFTTPTFKPVPPAQAAAEVAAHLRLWATRSREDFQVAVAAVRAQNPKLLEGLSDEQAMVMIQRTWDDAVRIAVAKVYNETGRGHELAIKIGGV
jgi:hypothetical protein